MAVVSAATGISSSSGPVRESRDFLMQGTVEYEFRTTAVKGLHTEESIAEAAQWISGVSGARTALHYSFSAFSSSTTISL